MYKAIIFDFFDVIHSDPTNRWFKERGLERGGKFDESSRMLDSGAIENPEFYKRLGELSGHSIESIEAVFNDTQRIDRGLVMLIAELQGHYKIGLLSNASGKYLRPILDEHGLTNLFDAIIVSAEVGWIKPQPEIFHHALKELGVKANETVFIDDNPGNVAAAESIGIKSIVYKSERDLRGKLSDLGIKTGS